MLRASIVRIDGTPLIDGAVIQGQQARRGSRDGNIWRGSLGIPSPQLRPTIGETIELWIDGGSKVSAVVTEVAGGTVHFRAAGQMPRVATAPVLV